MTKPVQDSKPVPPLPDSAYRDGPENFDRHLDEMRYRSDAIARAQAERTRMAAVGMLAQARKANGRTPRTGWFRRLLGRVLG